MQRAATWAWGVPALRQAIAATNQASQAVQGACAPLLCTRGFASDAGEASTRPTWDSGHAVKDLADVPAGKYFALQPELVPEATAEYYEEPYLKKEKLTQPNYGCKAVQREFEASGRPYLLQRPVIQRLLRHAESGDKRQISLQGWTGSGKSAALYALVSWARASGWIALYVPSAFSMVQGGNFNRGEDGLFDMPQGARYILQSMLQTHEADLKALPHEGGGSLAELAATGLASTRAEETVAAAIGLKDALAAQSSRRVLLAVDDYNALYHRTVYGEAVHPLHRRLLTPDELRLVRGFRLLEQAPPAAGLAVAAHTFSGRVPRGLEVPMPKRCRVFAPRLDLEEVRAAAAAYAAAGATEPGAEPSDDAVRRAFFLCNGNGRELRRNAAVLLAEQDMLGPSLGYKAARALKKQHLAGEGLF